MPKIPFWIFIVVAVINVLALRLDVMDVDAAQYAEMSREMSQTHNYLQLYDRGADYLDKPPFLFWVSSVSMNIFGANNFGYKFPTFLFAMLALYGTYRLARLLYDEQTGRTAALILGTSQGFFLMTNDVRTDTILMCWVVLAIWQIKEWDVKRKMKYMVRAAACIAFGMMTKGPIALVVPLLCFAADWTLKQHWRRFFNPAFLVGLAVIGILLIPMSIGLYQQFDMHPGKIINGEKINSGLRFFYWTQSFGRITGESSWNNGAGFDFLFVNMGWSFLPWILLFIMALCVNISELIQQKLKLKHGQEWITTGGFFLTYIVLASSGYQLPHYIFVAFPLAAIVTANLLRDFAHGKQKQLHKVVKPVQIGVTIIILITSLLTFVYVFRSNILIYIVWITGIFIWLWVVTHKKINGKTLWTSVVSILIVNVVLTNHFYPRLFQYQVGSKVGRYIRHNEIPAGKIYAYNMTDPLNSLHFYAHKIIQYSWSFPTVHRGDYLLTMQTGLDTVIMNGYNFEVIDKGRFFKISELTPQFLNPATRKNSLNQYFFIRIK